ncbi:probable F-box protein At1g14315, partial [Triticum urartu]
PPPATEAGGGTPARLPHDVVFDILSWVPVKSACRFKSVCREWRALINDPAFVAAHKARAEPLLAIAANSCDEPSTLRLIDMDGHIIKVMKNAHPILRLVCSSPGNLMCVVGYSMGIATLLNLATGEETVIHLKFGFMGFGRAAPSGAYKMVSINPSSCEILTVGDGVGWRQAQPLPSSSISYNSRPVVVRGVLYLILVPQLNGDSVICFDLESEEWKGGIRGPPSSQRQRCDASLQELNGALCMLLPEVGTMGIWLLIDSCKGVWIKVYSIPMDPSAYSPITPLRILVGDDGKLLFYITLKFDEFAVLQIYDPRHRTFTDAPKMLAGDNGGSISLCSLHLDSFLPANV